MNSDLERFLGASDLDELLAARQTISTIARNDAAELSTLVGAGADTQAMANLLMYPEIIPEPLRLPTLLAALDRDPSDFLLVAAVVGVVRVELDPADRARVAKRLLDLSARAPAPVSILAARSAGRFIGAVDVQLGVTRLGDLRATERHNVFAGLIKEFGVAKIREALAFAREAASMSPDDIHAIEERLNRAENDPLSNLRIPLLARIPNLSDWHPEKG